MNYHIVVLLYFGLAFLSRLMLACRDSGKPLEPTTRTDLLQSSFVNLVMCVWGGFVYWGGGR